MRRARAVLVAAAIVAALIPSGCGGERAPYSAGGRVGDTGTPRATASQSSSPQPAAPQPGAPQATSPASTAAPGVRIGVARTPQFGTFLTDANGRALYLLEEDGRGQSTCYEMCAAIWPPLLAGQSTPAPADSSVQGNLLGTVPRRGGGAQVTYNGHPLYYYLGDAKPGDTRGQHVEDSWGEWYLVSPSGRHVGGDGERESGRGGRGRRGRGGGEDR